MPGNWLWLGLALAVADIQKVNQQIGTACVCVRVHACVSCPSPSSQDNLSLTTRQLDVYKSRAWSKSGIFLASLEMTETLGYDTKDLG